MGSDDGAAGGKPTGRLGKMKGFLGGGRNKKGKNGGTDTLTGGTNQDTGSDNISIASSIFSTISKATNLTAQRGGDLLTAANGLLEKPIHPLVRKIGEHKLVLWPPDEYFDTVMLSLFHSNP